MAEHVLSVDVEDWFQVENLRTVVSSDRWNDLPSRLEASVDKLLELFARHEVRVTCFVLGTAAERCPQAVRRIAEAGHEVGCHGWSHELVYRQSPETFREETIRSKALLEDLSGQPVRGYRASTFSITEASLWALDILVEAGFGYDSSIAPLRHDRYGIPDAPRHPFRLRLASGAQIDEFPVDSARFLGLRLPLGGGFFRLLPFGWARRALARAERDGRSCMLYIHPWEIDAEQPRVDGLGAMARFRHYSRLASTFGKLDRLLGLYRWATMSEVLDRMRDRLPEIQDLGKTVEG